MSAISSSVRFRSVYHRNPWANICVVASKCGFDVFGEGPTKVTNSAAHIKEYIEGTIERLGFTPDLYYLHRMDPGTFPAVQA